MNSTRTFIFFLLIFYSNGLNTIENRTITEKQGRDVLLPCRFEKLNSKDRVMWAKDGLILSVGHDISGDRAKYEVINEYDLIIKSTDTIDNGQYICQNFDQKLSLNMYLTVLTKPAEPVIEQINKNLIENSSGEFRCITYGGYPLPNFRWFINQSPINQTFNRNSLTNHRSISELNFPLEKNFHNSSLICQIDHQALDKPLTTSYQLNIHYKPRVNLYENQTQISNSHYLIHENDYLIINCQIDANPKINQPITWLKNGISLSETSSSLILRNLQRIDRGEYTCLATNAIGYGQASLFIRIQYSPSVSIKGGGLITENDRLILTCHVDAYPSVDSYQWYKNIQKLNLSSSISTIQIDRVSKDDQGVYICLVKNTLKYSNGSLIEKFNQTQTKVIVQYAPKISTNSPILAEDLFSKNVTFICSVDSYPSSIISWSFRNQILFNSNKYTLLSNSTILILHQIQSSFDYGIYSCNASNPLGYNSTTIQLRSKGLPESPSDLIATNISYSKIVIRWKEGFHGGWNQSFFITINNIITKETNRNEFILTNLEHMKTYNISIRAWNRLGQSENYTSILVKTKDIPMTTEDLSIIENSYINLPENILHYRLHNESFYSISDSLCIRLERNLCVKIVTSTGNIYLRQYALKTISNISICLDEYEEFCSETNLIEIKYDRSFNWIFLLIFSLIILVFLIFIFCLICLICKCQQRRRQRHVSPRQRDHLTIHTLKSHSSEQPIHTTNSATIYDQLEKRKISMHSSDPVLSSSSLSILDQYDHRSSSIEKDERHESGYSTPMKTKKTVYEVVV